MAMIQGIDAGALIRAFRAGKEDRFSDDEAKRKAASAQALQGVMGNLFRRPQGVAAQMGVEAWDPKRDGIGGGIAQQQAGYPSPPSAFDQAFGGGAQEGTGELPAIPRPVAPPMQQPGRMELNPEAFAQLIGLDSEMAGKVVSAIKGADEIGLKRMQAKNDALAQGAAWLARIPAAERPAALREVLMPHLAAAGWAEQEIIGRPLTDQALGLYQNQALTMDQIVDNELKQREFEAGKAVPVTGGGNVAIITPDGKARWAVGGSAPAAGDAPRVSTPQDYAAIPPGGHYFDPQGNLRTKPGGASGNAGGGFPGAQ
jgi:hypothetical protein